MFIPLNDFNDEADIVKTDPLMRIWKSLTESVGESLRRIYINNSHKSNNITSRTLEYKFSVYKESLNVTG